MTGTVAERRTHETTPPDDPAARLAYYEAVVDESVRLAETEQQRAWLALEQIHAEQLWKTTHRSWDDYLTDRFALARSTAYRQIAWARSVKALPDSSRGAGLVELSPSQREVERRTKPPAPPKPPQGRREAVEAKATVTTGSSGSPTVASAPVESASQPAPEQLSLLDEIDRITVSVRAALDALAASDRRILARRLRSLLDEIEGAPTPRAMARGETERKVCSCSKGPTKSLTVAGLCTTCHGWFR